MNNDPKFIRYATMITSQIGDMFSNEDSSNFIDLEELNEGDNLKHFFHALSTVAPTHLFNKFMNDNKDHLEFNHVANHLCFEFMTKEKE